MVPERCPHMIITFACQAGGESYEEGLICCSESTAPLHACGYSVKSWRSTLAHKLKRPVCLLYIRDADYVLRTGDRIDARKGVTTGIRADNGFSRKW